MLSYIIECVVCQLFNTSVSGIAFYSVKTIFYSFTLTECQIKYLYVLLINTLSILVVPRTKFYGGKMKC